MKRTRKSSRVSWATGANLCQVKLFLSEDCPSKVGQKSQHHLQAKTSLVLHSSDEEYDLPPGFEGNHFLNQSKVEFSLNSQIKWECSPQFILSYHWRVAAGEESREKKDQKMREMKVLEAIYPRLSAIPPSPSVSLDVEEEDYDDNLTPLIPLKPIEEEEESLNNVFELTPAVNAPTHVQSQNLQQYISTICSNSAMPLAGISPGIEIDLAAALAIVAAAITKSNEQGSLLDMDLLLRILNNPTMLERLINETKIAATNVINASMGTPTSGLKPWVSSSTTPSLDAEASGITPTSTMGFGLRPTTLPVSLLKPIPDKFATMSVPTMASHSLLKSKHDKLETSSFPLSRPMPSKLAAPPVSFSPPPPPHMHRPVKNIHFHMSNGMPPQQDTVLAYGVKRAAPLPSITFNELSYAPLPYANLHSVVNQVQSTAAVNDANNYKNLVRQHGADKQDMQNSQISISHGNFQELKPVHNKAGKLKHKIQKPCKYFKSSRGCRNGSNCPYRHDMPVQSGAGKVLGGQNAKRLKL